MINPKKLKVLRVYHNLSQQQLAQLSGLSESLIAAMELGTRTITFHSQQKLTEILVTNETTNQIMQLIF